MNPPWNALSGAIDGHVHLRGSLAYEPLAPAFNARFDHRQPEAIVRGASPEDVAETIRFVTRHRLEHATRFVPRPRDDDRADYRSMRSARLGACCSGAAGGIERATLPQRIVVIGAGLRRLSWSTGWALYRTV
jgi:hypothetical protein